jgi:hypothetical protein
MGLSGPQAYNSMLRNAECSLWRAGSIKIIILPILRNKFKFFPTKIFFSLLFSQNLELDLDPDSTKSPDPDPASMNMDLK